MKNCFAIFRRFILLSFALFAASTAYADNNKLIVGATATGTPFTFLDIKTNTIQGMMIDTAEAVAKAGGFEVTIQQNTFSSLIPSLTSGKIDLISAGMLKTEERAKVVEFSTPVYSYGEGLLINAEDNNSYPDLQSLKGQVVGVQAGTIFYDILTKMGIFKEIRTYESVAEMARDLSLNRIKAAVGDAPIMAYQIQQKVFKNVKLAADFKPANVSDVCIVLRKGDTANLDRVNKAIDKIKADGTLAAIYKKWGL